MIVIENLTIHAGSFGISGLSLEIPAGHYVVLMGKTGSGKTTLLETICGLREASSGSIHLQQRDVTSLHPADRGIGYVPQDRALFPTMSVFENLAFAMRVRKQPAQVIDARVAELSRLLNLTNLLQRSPFGLSGGEQQRVALGRALAARPALLLLDEPLSALDDETRQEMYLLLRNIQKETGVTTLHVTHSRAEAQALADRIVMLSPTGVVDRPDLKNGNAPH